VLELGKEELLADQVPGSAGSSEAAPHPPLLLAAEHRDVLRERVGAPHRLAIAARIVRAILAIVEHRDLRPLAPAEPAVDAQLVERLGEMGTPFVQVQRNSTYGLLAARTMAP
jgi:hypothetical protein